MPRNLNLEIVLQNWVVAHEGRLWQTTEETSAITEHTGFTKSQINNWFAPRRKKARLALERVLLESPGAFLSVYSFPAVKPLKHFFASVAEHGYLPEAGKALIVESTGLSTRSIVDLFDKLRKDTRFAYAVSIITKMVRSDPVIQADAGQPTDVSVPLSLVTPFRPMAPAPFLPSSAPSQLIQLQRVTDTASTTSFTSTTMSAITRSSKKRNRGSTCLQDAQDGNIFAWHRGRQVNLTTEVEPLLRNYPGVQSAACLSQEQRLIGFISPDTICASQLQQQLQYCTEPCLVPHLVFALQNIPLRGNGTVDFETLRTIAMKYFPPRAEGEYGCAYCNRSYKNASLAAAHLQCHTGPFFICSLPNCRANVGRIFMVHHNLRHHMEEHKRKGDITDLAVYPPSRPDAEGHWQRTPQEVQVFIAQLLAQKVDAGPIRDDAHRILNSNESEKKINQWYVALKQQAAILAEDATVRTTDISEETQAQVLSYNLSRVKRELSSGVEVAFTNWSRKCLGPRPSLQWVTERCPRNACLEWATAKVKPNRSGMVVDFDIRCLECAKEFALYELFQSYGVLADDDDTGTVCAHESCSYSQLYRSLYCSVHLLSQTVSSQATPEKQKNQRLVSQQLRATGVWNLDRSSNFGPFLNRRSLPNGPRFFALDLEGYLTKNPPEVEQAAAVDIDLMGNDGDQIIFNVNIKSPTDVNDKKNFQEAETQDFGLNLLKFGTRDFWEYNKETLSGERVDPNRAATMIKESGITCHDYILVWHKHYADVDALRYLLSQAGVQGVLPPNDHVIRLPYIFRHNLGLPKGVRCGLEFLFSIIFPAHPLRFTHHDVLVDSKKAALMALFAEKLCNGESVAAAMSL